MLLYLKLLKKVPEQLQVENASKLFKAISTSTNILQYGIFQDWLQTLLVMIGSFSNKIVLGMKCCSLIFFFFPKKKTYSILDNLLQLVKLFISNHIAVHHVKLLFHLFQSEEGQFKVYFFFSTKNLIIDNLK